VWWVRIETPPGTGTDIGRKKLGGKETELLYILTAGKAGKGKERKEVQKARSGRTCSSQRKELNV